MEALNRAASSLFDAVFGAFEWIGPRTALIAVSGIFGVLALLAFKHLSSQTSIAKAKGKITAHLIEIRIYQDDLGVVASSFAKIMLRNAQYLALNFLPFLPLAVPFAVLAAQAVVRYAYSGVPVFAADGEVLSGRGVLLEIETAPEHRQLVKDLHVSLPPGVRAVSPLVRSVSEGKAWQEVVATTAGVHAISCEIAGEMQSKQIVAGVDVPRRMQPRRASARDWWRMHEPERWSILWPAEATLPADSHFRSIALVEYPARDLGWLPGGEGGVLVVLVVASMLFGVLALKPLKVTI